MLNSLERLNRFHHRNAEALCWSEVLQVVCHDGIGLRTCQQRGDVRASRKEVRQASPLRHKALKGLQQRLVALFIAL